MGYIWPNVEGLNGQVVNSQGPMSEQPARVRHGAAKARGRQKGGEGAIGEQVVVPNASVLEATGLERGGGCALGEHPQACEALGSSSGPI